MLFYIVLLIILILFNIPYKNKNLYISFFLLLILSLLRGNTVGLDTMNYVTVDSSIEQTDSIKSFEYLFFVIVRASQELGGRFVIVSFSLITFFCLLKSSKQLSVRIQTVMLFFFLLTYYNLSLNISRQFAAISIVAYAYSTLIVRFRKIKATIMFVVLVLLAACLHVSALAALIALPWLYGFEQMAARVHDKKKLGFIICCILIVMFFYFHYGRASFEILNLILLTHDSSDLTSSYSDYYRQAELLAGGSTVNEISIWLVFLCKLFALYVIVQSKDLIGSKIAGLFILSIIVSIIFSKLYGNINRLQYYFSVFDVFVYSYLLKLIIFNKQLPTANKQISQSNRYIKSYIYYFLLLLSNFIIFYSFLRVGGTGTIPYRLDDFL